MLKDDSCRVSICDSVAFVCSLFDTRDLFMFLYIYIYIYIFVLHSYPQFSIQFVANLVVQTESAVKRRGNQRYPSLTAPGWVRVFFLKWPICIGYFLYLFKGDSCRISFSATHTPSVICCLKNNTSTAYHKQHFTPFGHRMHPLRLTLFGRPPQKH